MKIWLDDKRNPPSTDWVWAKDLESFIKLIDTSIVTDISFDYNLDAAVWQNQDGFNAAHELRKRVRDGIIEMPNWFVHSEHPDAYKIVELLGFLDMWLERKNNATKSKENN